MDKKLFFVLLLVAIYVFFMRPLAEKSNSVYDELSVLNKAIAKEKFISKQKEKIKKVFPAYEKINKRNLSFLFPAKMSNSKAFSEMQRIIKEIAAKSKVRIISFNWGVPIKAQGYSKLPMSVMISGPPSGIGTFLRKVSSSRKIFTVHQMILNKSGRKNLILNALIFSYKVSRVQK